MNKEKLPQSHIKETKNALEKELSLIEEELKEIADRDPDSDTYKIKFPDYGKDLTSDQAEVEEIDKRTAIFNVLVERREKIKKTLEKIKSGTYGTCEKCAGQIIPARLKAMPVAYHCTNCAD